MPGIKIINIFRDDAFQDILEIFRKSDASEVIFVLPKNGKVFRTEDHFAAFASEAATGGKTISLLSNSPQANSWARKYKFTLMSSGAPVKAKKTKATLASVPPPADNDIQPTDSEDAFDDSNENVSQDEKMGRQEPEDAADPLHGMHIEDEEGNAEEPKESDLTVGEADLVMAKTAKAQSAVAADLDYIDTMWRQKAAQPATPPSAPLEAAFTMARRSAPASVWSRIRLPKFPKMKGPMTVGILVAAIAVLGTAVYLTTGSASIVITPVAHALTTQAIIQASDTFLTVDSDFNKLPGQLFQVEKTAAAEVVSSGQRDVASKARGKITITNTFSSASQTLIATTRFTSASGLVYRSLQGITVPGSTIKNGAIVPGTATVEVVADQPGAQYNIASTSFTIPAFKERGDMDRYGKFIGTSATPFSGGANGPSKVVTQADYDKAKAMAIDTVTQEIKDAFAQEGNGIMIVDSITPEISDVQSTARPDDAATSVSVTVTAKLKTVAFRKADLAALLVKVVLKKEHVVVVPDTLTLSYSDVMLNAETGILTFTTAISGTGYDPIDERGITQDILGMSSSNIHDYFAKKEGVELTTVSLSPFWVRTVPQKVDRIHLQVRYEGQPR